ncbi:MAG: type II toxin-antitoxin system Phd/YefM family antitoxin [Anaerolineae bacterium]
MGEQRVGVRQLKEHLGEYLARVKAGETLIITERGKPVGRIVTEERSLEERLQPALEAGLGRVERRDVTSSEAGRPRDWGPYRRRRCC